MKSVRPAPISIRSTPASFSSSSRTASAEAIIFGTVSDTPTFASSTALFILSTTVVGTFMACKSTESFDPTRPKGFIIPSASSSLYLLGIICRMSYPSCFNLFLPASKSLFICSSVISLDCDVRVIPSVSFWLIIFDEDIPRITSDMSKADFL